MQEVVDRITSAEPAVVEALRAFEVDKALVSLANWDLNQSK
jgi:hypothetical protein